ncbi:unnamed protein product [Brassica rapa]|uniref:Uncharacterized protein n=1 Tax=Brassica campestris TaxID=3711 RepID=A0A8D9GNL8_BRACM|nr:unnamed protein product [Brassica rapa]
MGRRSPRLTLMSRSFFSLHLIGHLKNKRERESESERGVAAARNGAPTMVSSSMMLPVYPSPSISSSEASWKHNKKFAKWRRRRMDWIYHKENKSPLSSCSSSYQLRPM